MLDRLQTTKPVWCVAFAFLITIAAARWTSYLKPAFHYNILGTHIHHYMYGIFMITLAGYFALVFKGPKATFWIALLYGWGAGFTFDEMGMWLNSSIDPRLRWENDGVVVAIIALLLAALIPIGLKKKAASKLPEPEIFDNAVPQED